MRDAPRERNLLDVSFALVLLVVVGAVVAQWVKQRPAWREIGVALGVAAGSLTNVQLTIESGGRTVYQFRLAPLTRTVGYDGDRHTISAEEHRARLRRFANWFFDESKFQSPAAFVDLLRRSLRLHIAEISASDGSP